MQYEFLLWIAVLANLIHQLEEIYLNGRNYLESYGIPRMSDGEYYYFQASFLLTGILMAAVGWRAPAFSLMYPILSMMNVIGVHLLMTIKYRKYSPGLLTGVVFILPVGIASLWGAAQDGVLNARVVVIASLLAIVYTLVPFLFIRMKKMLYKTKRK